MKDQTNPQPIEIWNKLEHQTQEVAITLRDGLLSVFEDGLAAIWLYGASIFGPDTVDFDFHVLLKHLPDAIQSEGIRALHKRIEVTFGVDSSDLDIWYILLKDAQRSEHPPYVGPWNSDLRDEHWSLHRAHWLAGACVIIYGLNPAQVVPPPTWEELRATLKHEADKTGLELESGNPYWTLQLCRVWASLETKNVVRSKIDSGQWAKQSLTNRLAAIIEASIRYYRHQPISGDADLIREQFPDFYRSVRARIDRSLT